MLPFANRSNCYWEVPENIDHRINAYKVCKESLLRKTEATVLLVQKALNAGIKADYVFVDTWFTTGLMLKELLETGIDVIGMVKQLKQRYSCQGKLYTLPELQKFMQMECPKISLAHRSLPQKAGFLSRLSLSAIVTSKVNACICSAPTAA